MLRAGVICVLAVGFSAPARADPILDEGKRLYEELEYKRAVEMLERALTHDLNREQRIEALKYLGLCQATLHQHAPAAATFKKLLEIEPDLGEARAGLRSAYAKRFEAKKGGSKFLRALEGAAPLAMAKTLRKAGKHDAAAKALESYLATSPLDVDANLMLGMSLEDGGHTRSALAVYEFLAGIAPKNPEGLKRAGAMAWRGGDPRTGPWPWARQRSRSWPGRKGQQLHQRRSVGARTGRPRQWPGARGHRQGAQWRKGARRNEWPRDRSQRLRAERGWRE